MRRGWFSESVRVFFSLLSRRFFWLVFFVFLVFVYSLGAFGNFLFREWIVRLFVFCFGEVTRVGIRSFVVVRFREVFCIYFIM